MVVRHDLDIDLLGKMAQLPQDISPLQIQTRGQFGNIGFELVGRLKMQWDGGFWNEWYAVFDDGREGWLAEAQGFYMISFQDIDASIPASKSVSVGQTFSLGALRKQFQVDDIKDTTCAGAEGELPFTSPKGRKSLNIDLSDSENGFACIEYADDHKRLYIGRYVDVNELAFTSLREIDGW